jgi:type IV pilus assembly protein PilC
MLTYQINAINRKGTEIREMVTADDPAALQIIVKKRDLFLIDYREIKSAAAFGKKLKTKDMIIFCRQLGTMVKAGIPILRAIDIQMRKTSKKDVRQIYSNINESVQKGNSLSTAMVIREGLFPRSWST